MASLRAAAVSLLALLALSSCAPPSRIPTLYDRQACREDLRHYRAYGSLLGVEPKSRRHILYVRVNRHDVLMVTLAKPWLRGLPPDGLHRGLVYVTGEYWGHALEVLHANDVRTLDQVLAKKY